MRLRVVKNDIVEVPVEVPPGATVKSLEHDGATYWVVCGPNGERLCADQPLVDGAVYRLYMAPKQGG